MSIKEKLKLDQLPKHVAIIMDGNGRWAKKKGGIRIFGHQNGVKAVREVMEASVEIGVPYVTLYAFSTENWNRPEDEVRALMELLVKTINAELKTLMDNNVKLNAIGDLSKLPAKVLSNLNDTIGKTSKNNRLTLTLALSYSSRWEIVQAVKNIALDVEHGNLKSDQINQQLFENYLTTKNIPDPELLIRTSGEYRVSNFLLYQLAYTELYFTDVLWPDFNREHFYQALLDYQHRERRFGLTAEQIKKS